PTPEKAAIEIMKAAALTSSERTFWKRLAATTAGLMLAMSLSIDAQAAKVESAYKSDTYIYIMRNTLCPSTMAGYCDVARQ
ncbi:MAG TPA: hypothetical protein H9827_03195, partial [Candidatus Luteimonas excrementigallinarum]|nr:hypothetical protein [Candidatus Luteimonas excrementigallinarum]